MAKKLKKTVVKATKKKVITRKKLGCIEAFKELLDRLNKIEHGIDIISIELRRQSNNATQKQYNRIRNQELQSRRDADVIPAQQMFDDLNNLNLPKNTRIFIDSLENGMEEYGTLTKRQYDCLHQNWNSFVNGIPF